MNTTEVWDRIERWLVDNAPAIMEDLNPGVDEATLEYFRERTGRELPETVRDSYRVHDGQAGGAPPLMGEWELLPLEYVVSKWEMIEEVHDDTELDPESVRTEGPVQLRWWSSEWLPVCGNGAGDYYCIDLAPASGGTVGQVITYWHMNHRRQVIAPDFGTLLAEFADDLERGGYRVERGGLVRSDE